MYTLATMGRCQGTRAWVGSKADCEEGARRLVLPDTTASGTSQPSRPYGCYYERSTRLLYWNPAGGRNSDDTVRISVCSSGGTCANAVCPTGQLRTGSCSATTNSYKCIPGAFEA